jgi:hypothetical protein
MDFDLGRMPARTRGWSLALVAAAASLALVDLVVLRGDRVDSASAPLSAGAPAVLEIERAGEEHVVEITTRVRRMGETKGRSIDYRLEAPDGRVIVDESEIASRKRRFIRFVPEVAGGYELHVQDEGLFGGTRADADVDVYVNDRRIFGPRLFSALPF